MKCSSITRTMLPVQQFHVDRLKPYFGTLASAKDLAQADGFQHVIVEITAHCGDPVSRKKMDFYIQYAEGSPLWIPWSIDLFQSVPYETYCRAHHHYIRSSSPLIVPRPRSRPSMISPSPSFNHSLVVTWISVGSPTAGTTPSSYPTPTSPPIYGPSNTKTSPTTVIRTNHGYVLTNFQVTCWGYPKTIVPSTVIITPALLSIHTSYLMTVVNPPYTPSSTSNTCMTSIL